MASRRVVLLVLLACSTAAAATSLLLPSAPDEPDPPAHAIDDPRSAESRSPASTLPDDPSRPRFAVYTGSSTRAHDKQFVQFLDGVPEQARRAAIPTGSSSNIQRGDYKGDVKVCSDCHEENYEKW